MGAVADLDLTYTDNVNPGRTDRGGDLIYSLAGEVELSGRPGKQLKTKLKVGAEAVMFNEYSDNNTQLYFAEARAALGRTTLGVEYDFIPERLYFPSPDADATYSRRALEFKLSRRMQKSWQVSAAYEFRWLDFVEAHSGRDNRTSIIQLELEYGRSRLLRPSVVLEWRKRNSEDDNHGYRSREIEFSIESSPTANLGLRIDYHVSERTYLTSSIFDSNYHRIDARSGFGAEARIPIRGPLGAILGYERREKDSSREEEERSYRVNSFACGLRLEV
jgi:hypothetical protein